MRPIAPLIHLLLLPLALGAAQTTVAQQTTGDEAEAVANAAPAAPCSGAEFRQLDFWVGDWDLSWTNADGSIGTGRNQISRDEYGDCVIYERFSSEQAQGMSVSTYFAPAGLWRQTWVDNTGGYFALTGGAVNDNNVAFELRNTRLSDEELQLRMIWENVTGDSLTWRWQSLAPEADPDSAEWVDRWVIHYQRRK